MWRWTAGGGGLPRLPTGNACRMDDRRVHIYFENALKYIRRCEEEYDLIIVDSSDPFGPSEVCSPASSTAAASTP